MKYVHDNSGLTEQIEGHSDFSVFFPQVFIQEETHPNIKKLRNFIKGVEINFKYRKVNFYFYVKYYHYSLHIWEILLVKPPGPLWCSCELQTPFLW